MSESYFPRRIACLQPSATVILASVGELERVVACTKYCVEVVPELRPEMNGGQKPDKMRIGERLIVADSWTSKADEILPARPDLVIASVPYQQAAVAEILKVGVRFLGLAPKTLNDIYSDIMTIAGIVGASERGAKVVGNMQAAIEEIRRKTEHFPRKRVFCEEWSNPVIASQPWVLELVAAAGGEFLGEPGKKTSADEIARLNPEVIVASWCGAGDRVPLEKLAARREWQLTAAVRNGQIYCISDELLNTPAPTLLGGLRALAAAIHPDKFGTQPGLRAITQVTK
jgi:iron complex transport system substrate-binding protein